MTVNDRGHREESISLNINVLTFLPVELSSGVYHSTTPCGLVLSSIVLTLLNIGTMFHVDL